VFSIASKLVKKGGEDVGEIVLGNDSKHVLARKKRRGSHDLEGIGRGLG